LIGKTVSLFENVNSTGEDIEKGELVLEVFHKIKAYDMGLLATLGIKNIKVHKKLKIGIISTGDEIIEYYEMPLQGQVRNSNSPSL
jgi:molybdopterin molybdotransferase